MRDSGSSAPVSGAQPTVPVAAAQFRTWAVMVPLHLVAFFLLYLFTVRLLERAYSEAGVEAARQRLEQVVREMPFFSPPRAGAVNPHLFVHALAAHRDIDLRLYDARSRPLGMGALAGATLDAEIHDFLAGGEAQRVWLERWGEREIVQGRTRLVAGEGCSECHVAGEVLGAASLRLDYTAQLRDMRRELRGNVVGLVVVWGGLLGVSAAMVRRSVLRSAARLRADLAAAEAGRGSSALRDGALVLDPVSAALHRSLRDFLARQRAREAELATRLERVDQLAHLGELAAGLAHEIKNPLAGIQGALEVLRDDARGSDADKERLYEEMLGELKRVNSILQRLLESGRPAPLRLVEADATALVRETVELLEPALRRRQVRLAAEIAPGLATQTLDPAKIRQVLVNLIQNSAEAMRDGGRVTVRVSRFPDGGGVVVAVEDDGPGITAADRERIFQPFFTTKFTGTGLGLAISRSLVEQHGGRIEVDSEPGRGTTMFVFLPGAGAPAEGAATAGEG